MRRRYGHAAPVRREGGDGEALFESSVAGRAVK